MTPHDSDNPRRRRTPATGIRVGYTEVVAYLSHTLGSSNGDDSIRRHDNIANAGRWLHFLVAAVPWIVVMPWFPYVSLDIDRERGFADQLRFIKRCDALLLCGGVVSSHMTYEVEQARRNRVAIVDLTSLGYAPPQVDPKDFAAELEQRLQAAIDAVRNQGETP